jgi:hypothetical protein
MTVRPVVGSRMPFAGWVVVDLPRPAPALMVEQPAERGWSALIVRAVDDAPLATEPLRLPEAFRWEGPDEWNLTVPTAAGTIELRRDGRTFVLTDGRTRRALRETFIMTDGTGRTGEREKIAASYRAAAQIYRKVPDIMAFRFKATYLVITAFAVQELGFGLYRRFWGAGYRGLRLLAVGGWAAGSIWLYITYLRPA